MKIAGKVFAAHNEFENMVIDLVATNPVNPLEGQIVWNTTDDKLYIYNGVQWLSYIAEGGTPTFAGLYVTGDSDLGRHVKIRDEMITLNHGETNAGIGQWGTTKAGIEVDRGSFATVSLYYDETLDKWVISNDGITAEEILTPSTGLLTYLKLDGTNSPTADIHWGNFKIVGLADPANPDEAATKNYVDAQVGSIITNYLRVDGGNSPTADISWANYKIIHLADPTNAQDAATKNYVDTEITTTGSSLYLKLDGTNSPSSDINWNNHKITNLANPTNDQDALNRITADGRYLRIDGSNSPTADINWNSHYITHLSGINSNAANLYLDAVSEIDFRINGTTRAYVNSYGLVGSVYNADLAEAFRYDPDYFKYLPEEGLVVSLNLNNGLVIPSQGLKNERIIGVIRYKPGLFLGGQSNWQELFEKGFLPVALIGQVPVLLENTNNIGIGDYLKASEKGFANKTDDKSEAFGMVLKIVAENKVVALIGTI